MWDGQGLKDPCFFETFFRITKSREKGESGFNEKITF